MVHSAEDGSIPVPNMSALIARLEAAEAGSRELDMSLAWHNWVEPKTWGSTNARGEPVWKVERDGKRVPLPAYTTSLDSALALAERVLPGFTWRVQRHTSGMFDAALWADPDDNYVGYGRTPSPALSLCIAILKAKAQGEGGC